ncbi:MAG: hypothetical protein KDJ44_05450, partial [Rhodoblastus sp.]|nr:hypothetical protein [Rhodoblastus sp.]
LAFAPLPPVRPAEFSRVAAYNAPLLRGLATPMAQPKSADRTSAIPPLPPRREAVAPARLDRSNFGAMSAARPTSRVTTQTVLGATIVAPRAAARARQSGMEAVGAPGQFGIRPTAPPTDRFAAPTGRQRAALTAAPRRSDDD